MPHRYKDIVKQLSSGPLSEVVPYFIFEFCCYIGNRTTRDITPESSYRHEGNSMTFHCFRAGYIEEIHAANDCLNVQTLNRISSDMSSMVNEWLLLRKKLTTERMGQDMYNNLVISVCDTWVNHWTFTESYFDIFDKQDFEGKDIDSSLVKLLLKHSPESKKVFILHLLSSLENELIIKSKNLLEPTNEAYFFTHYAFNSSKLVKLIKGGKAQLDNRNMKKLNIEISSKLEELLRLKDSLSKSNKNSVYNQIINCYCATYAEDSRQHNNYYESYSTDIDEMFENIEKSVASTFKFSSQ
jgi:hypothetical protein